jgi:hypothetical protein
MPDTTSPINAKISALPAWVRRVRQGPWRAGEGGDGDGRDVARGSEVKAGIGNRWREGIR